MNNINIDEDADMARWMDEYRCTPPKQFEEVHEDPPNDNFIPHTKSYASQDISEDELEYDEIKAETSKAWLLIMATSRKIWWPKSICSLDEDAQILTVPHWLVLKKIEELK
jgi:hypothetical protein